MQERERPHVHVAGPQVAVYVSSAWESVACILRLSGSAQLGPAARPLEVVDQI